MKVIAKVGQLRRVGTRALIAGAGWIIVAIYAVHPVLPANPIKLPFQQTVAPLMHQAFPEGFAFFTRSPRERDLDVLRRTRDGWRRIGGGTSAEPRHLFGLNRVGRARSRQLGVLVMRASPDEWSSCTELPADCLDHARVHQVRNHAPHPLLCGRIGVAEQEPVPWAWSRQWPDTIMPSRVLNLEVSC